MITAQRKSSAFLVVVTVLTAAFPAVSIRSAFAQLQTVIGTPFQQTGTSFSENFGVGFNYSNDNFSINVPNGVQPPFGLGDPNADGRLGFGFRGPNGGSGSLNFTFGQGSTTTNSVTTPSLTLPNGGTGSIFSGSIRPFVTSVIPVVGQGGTVFVPNVASNFGAAYPAQPLAAPVISPLRQKLEQLAAEGKLGTLGNESAPRTRPQIAAAPRQRASSSAERGDISVAEIRRQQGNDDRDASAAHEEAVAKAAKLEAEGKLFSARQQYEKAARQAPSELRTQLRSEAHRISRLIEANRVAAKNAAKPREQK